MKKILILVMITAIFIGCDSAADDVTLNASISKSETQLIVKNNDSFDWTNVEIKINDEYAYTASLIRRDETANIGFLNFTASDGKRFNPFSYKAQGVTISCKVDDKYGFVSSIFN